MKQTSRLLSMMLLTMTVSCSSGVAPVTSPPSTVAPIFLHHTNDTSSLLDLLLANTGSFDFEIQARVGSHASLIRDNDAGLTRYFITHHRSLASQDSLEAIPLAQDGIAFIVHPDNPVRDISLEELQRMYQGLITNWSALGGTGDEIQLYSREDASAMRLEFSRLVMGQQRISPNARVLTSSEQLQTAIDEDISGIAYIPISALSARSNSLSIASIEANQNMIAANHYPLRMTIYAVGSGEPSREYQQMFLWFQRATDSELFPFVPLPR